MKKERKNMMFVVTDGEFSDYRICGVFSSRFQAENACKKLGGRIEEWPLDTPALQSLALDLYNIDMTPDGDILKCERRALNWDTLYWVNRENVQQDSALILHILVLARDKTHATKLAKDAYAQRLLKQLIQQGGL